MFVEIQRLNAIIWTLSIFQHLLGGGWVCDGVPDQAVGIGVSGEEVGQLASLLRLRPHRRQQRAQKLLTMEVQEVAAQRLLTDPAMNCHVTRFMRLGKC